MNIQTINESWKSYESMVLPKEAGEIQRREMKRAFFAGFGYAMDTLLELSVFDEDDGVERLKRFTAEIRGFTEAVKLGVA